jgi:RNA polymerase sigma-70 factor (ECF subfamily)
MTHANESLAAAGSLAGHGGSSSASRPNEAARWFAQEVKPHEPALRSVLRRLVTSLSDVDDLVQECYLRILRARERVPIRSSKAFLFTTARNAAHDLRRRRVVANAIVFEETDASCVLQDDCPGVADSVCHQQELALLAEAIHELPERCRQVFLLRKIQELPQKEIARRLGISESTVETLVAKGAARCADYLHRRGLTSR